MSNPVRFDRKPYYISYVDSEGHQQKIRRVPPPKLHNALPTDKVELRTRRSDNFQAGDEVTVKHINPRHPNVLQVENGDGKTTFISHYDMRFEQKGGQVSEIQTGSPASDDSDSSPISSSYLDWP